MRKFCFLLIFILTTNCFPQESNYKANAAAASSSQATALSMVTWGIVLTGGIVAICLLVKSSSSSHEHD